MDLTTFGKSPAAIRLSQIINELPEDHIRSRTRRWWAKLYLTFVQGIKDLAVVEHRYTHRLLWLGFHENKLREYLPDHPELEKFRTYGINVLRGYYRQDVRHGGNKGPASKHRDYQRKLFAQVPRTSDRVTATVPSVGDNSQE